MDLLFTLDEHNYTEDMPLVERFAVRAIICEGGQLAMQQSKFGDFKLPGGGIEAGETAEETLRREVQEEVGLIVKPESIRAIGEARELRQDGFEPDKRFVAHTYYFFCEVEEARMEPEMTQSERKLGYRPVWATLEDILKANAACLRDFWQKRDYRVLTMLKDGRL